MKPLKPSSVEDFGLLRFPLLGSPKIDGFRCRIAKHEAMTSNWKPFVNPYVQGQLIDCPPGLDGEITVGMPRGEGVYNRTSSGVTAKTGEPKFTFWVFDTFAVPDAAFVDRHKAATMEVKRLKNKHVAIVPHRLIHSMDELLAYEAQQLLAGYEGIMLRDPQGVYKFGRSTPKEGILWRIKRFEDSEFRIEGWFEEQANNNEAKADELGRSKRSSHKANKTGKGRLGGFTGTDIHTGQPVRVGTGFKENERIAWWMLDFDKAFKGKFGKYKKQMVGEKDKPRHSVWLGFRDPDDIEI